MTGPTRAEVLATPPRDADAEDCQPEWQPRPTRTTTLPSIDDYEEPEMTDDPAPCRTTQHCAVHGFCHRCNPPLAEAARHVVKALNAAGIPDSDQGGVYARTMVVVRGAYVPPPPGSDRDKLPDHLLAVAAPHMPPYTSTYCQMADALEAAAIEHPELAGELREAAGRQRSSCRITRKQDMAKCQHPQHREAGR